MLDQYNVILIHLFNLKVKTRRATLLHALGDKVPNLDICLSHLMDKKLIEEVSKYGNESYKLSTYAYEMMEKAPEKFKQDPYGYLKIRAADKERPNYKKRDWIIEKIVEHSISGVVVGLLGFFIGLSIGKTDKIEPPEKPKKEKLSTMQRKTGDSTKILK
jgi:hypothetical protein